MTLSNPCEMLTAAILILITGDVVWKALAGVGTLVGVYVAYKRIMADLYIVALTENKRLRADVARLLREAAMQIENVQEYQSEVDGLQSKLAQQRAQISDFELKENK